MDFGVDYGNDHKGGRRTGNLKTPKEELLHVIGALHDRGIGSRLIARMLGYSSNMIDIYRAEYLGRKPKTQEQCERDKVRLLYDSLPDDLRARVAKIKTRSDAYHEKHRNRIAGTRAAHVHVADPEYPPDLSQFDGLTNVEASGTIAPQLRSDAAEGAV